MRLIDAEKLNREVKEHCKKLIDEGVKEVDVVDICAEIVTLVIDAQTEFDENESAHTGRWISVRDRIPPDQEEVLVCTLAKNGVQNIDKGYWAIDHFIHRGRSQVTHWMPLPELPEEVAQ